MTRKVILDLDPGIDDAVGLALALVAEQTDVIAVTATAGKVGPELATRNVQALVEQLDPPRWPRIGAAPTDVQTAADTRNLHGEDGLGDCCFEVSVLHNRHPSEKLICDTARAYPGDVTLIALGPLTNVARTFHRDAEVASMLRSVIVAGGTFAAAGDVTAAAEFNVFRDREAARMVFHSEANVTVVPLDVSRELALTYAQVGQICDSRSQTSRVLGQLLPFALRAHRQHLGLESIDLHDVAGVVMALHPELFGVTDAHVEVETAGDVAIGSTVFDRRPNASEKPNVAVATAVDREGMLDCVLRCLGT